MEIGNLSYTPLEHLRVRRPVDRMRYIVERCRGRRVLDLGCYDETALVKVESGDWLHGALAGAAATLLGVDNSPRLPADELVTGPRSRIIRGDVTQLAAVLPASFDPEIVVAGELIEHLSDALSFLRQLKALFAGRELIASTPNATSFSNAMLACLNRENAHPDHLQVFSFKTLNTLCLRARFVEWEILPYRVFYTEMALRHRGLRRLTVRAAEALVRGVETLFPLLAFGLLLHVKRV